MRRTAEGVALRKADWEEELHTDPAVHRAAEAEERHIDLVEALHTVEGELGSRRREVVEEAGDGRPEEDTVSSGEDIVLAGAVHSLPAGDNRPVEEDTGRIGPVAAADTALEEEDIAGRNPEAEVLFSELESFKQTSAQSGGQIAIRRGALTAVGLAVTLVRHSSKLNSRVRMKVRIHGRRAGQLRNEM